MDRRIDHIIKIMHFFLIKYVTCIICIKFFIKSCNYITKIIYYIESYNNNIILNTYITIRRNILLETIDNIIITVFWISYKNIYDIILTEV
jgi:hypothetical protein